MIRHHRVRAASGRILVPSLVFVGMVVAVISSLGAPLIPAVAAANNVSLSDAQWSLTISFLVSAVATPLMGRLGDGPHRRAVILIGLGIVTVGGVLAALPLGFASLLTGRGLQGVGLGLVPLGMAVARDALPVERARPAVATLSITTAAGIGLGYPITGLIAQYGGLHAAFWFGAAVSALAFVVATLVIPSSAHNPPRRLDAAGAVLLGAALAGLLLAISEGGSWGWTSARLVIVGTLSLAGLAGWVLLELRRTHPLVEVRLLRLRTVFTADVTVLLTGVGFYLLVSLMTRFVQTPLGSGYGLGASTTVAGLVLLPFSAASLAASKIAPALVRRVSAGAVPPIGSGVMVLSMLMFTYARDSLWEIIVIMGIAGLGVGCILAVLPGFIVGSVPAHETGSALSFNQVLRYIGFAVGSALSAVVLQAHTAPGQALPEGDGYTVAGLTSCGVWVLTAAVTLVLPRLRTRTSAHAVREEPVHAVREEETGSGPDGSRTSSARCPT
jgi:predicted MFS family arabinose efflux permease